MDLQSFMVPARKCSLAADSERNCAFKGKRVSGKHSGLEMQRVEEAHNLVGGNAGKLGRHRIVARCTLTLGRNHTMAKMRRGHDID